MELSKKLSKNMKTLRGSKSQAAFSKEIGIAKATVNSIETQRASIRLDTLEVICLHQMCIRDSYNGAPVNNGYGCRHPECGEDEEDDAGQPCGCCHRYTCPICCPFGEEDLDDPELDLDGRGRQELFDRDGGFADGGELVTVASGDEAGEEERAALLAYNRYLHRYDKEWLEKHPRQEPQSPAR